MQDRATAVILGVQNSLSLSITPRFLAVSEGDTVMSSTVTDLVNANAKIGIPCSAC